MTELGKMSKEAKSWRCSGLCTATEGLVVNCAPKRYRQEADGVETDIADCSWSDQRERTGFNTIVFTHLPISCILFVQ
jgi:hypothetical protein